MKKYKTYKDSGVEWIGGIPEHWISIPLKHLVNIQGRVGYKGYTVSDLVSVGEGPYTIGAKHISKQNQLNLSSPEYISWDKYYESPEIMVQKGDLLLTQRGTLGKVVIIKNDIGEATINPSMVLLNQLKIDGKYLYYFFTSDYFLKWIDLNNTATAVPMISQEQLGNFNILKPTLEEQTQIANYLDQKTAEIDTLITKKERLIKLLEEEHTAMINQAVTKGLDPNVPMKDSGIYWLGEIPEHWEIKKLKFFAEIVLGKMLTNEDKGGYFLKPYLRAKNIEWSNPNIEDVKEMWFSKVELKKYRVSKGDLLVSEGGEVGRTCIWNDELEECYIQNSVLKVTLLFKYNPFFYLYLFILFGTKGHFDAIVNKISIGHLTKEKLSGVSFMCPPISEQEQISYHIKTEQCRIDMLKSKTLQEIDLLKEYKTALISEVVTGKIDIREEVLN